MTKFQARTVRRWSLVHKWTSLIATIFLLVLCVTGLPLVFHQEIDNYLNPPSSMPAMPPGTQATTLDTIVAEALKRHPGDVPVSLWLLPGSASGGGSIRADASDPVQSFP